MSDDDERTHRVRKLTPRFVHRCGFIRAPDYWSYAHWCQACGSMHDFDERWTYDGNQDTPTFSPSMKITWEYHESEGKKENCCHYFLRNGKIEYCSDSTHFLSGQTVDLPDIPSHVMRWAGIVWE